jgi:hypothetical protein
MYQLRVIQQPERARACGTDAFLASADRRPVDPPPVVELRIFEGDSMNDITFSHNANFFLYATLETARVIAQGRVQQPPASFPVLTGFPVSSMAYLDRPTPAGYFIFPDLSVRHEGKYKLAFNLYEEVKEAKDGDAEPAANHPDHPNNKPKAQEPHAPQEHYHWRLEVQSLPFTVFSAKKFPGLAESTALSRIVAEQGCRVRIRRDVRMRRRENKASKEYDDFDDERMYSGHEAPVEAYQGSIPNSSERGDRQSSVATANAHPSAPYEAERRSSLQEPNYYPPQYQSGYPGPPSAAQAASHLSFGPHGQQYATPQYPSGPPQNPQPQMYAENQYGYPQGQPQSQAPNSHPYMYVERQNLMNGQYSQPLNGHGRMESVDSKVQEWQQHSQQFQPQYQPKPNGYSYSPQNFQPTYMNNPTPRTPTPPGAGPSSLPPLKVPMPMEPKYESAMSPAAPPSRHHSLPSPGMETAPTRPSTQGQYSNSVSNDASRTSKRVFGSVFESSHYDQPLTDGSRPSDAHYGADLLQPAYEEDDYDTAHDMARLKLQYKRADGTEISRRLTVIR